jgi:hypothetical protein
MLAAPDVGSGFERFAAAVVSLGLGVIAGWRRDEDMRAALSLNRMVFFYALPLALFAGTVVIPRTELLSDWPLLSVISVRHVPALSRRLRRRTLYLQAAHASCGIAGHGLWIPGDRFHRPFRF